MSEKTEKQTYAYHQLRVTRRVPETVTDKDYQDTVDYSLQIFYVRDSDKRKAICKILENATTEIEALIA